MRTHTNTKKKLITKNCPDARSYVLKDTHSQASTLTQTNIHALIQTCTSTNIHNKLHANAHTQLHTYQTTDRDEVCTYTKKHICKQQKNKIKQRHNCKQKHTDKRINRNSKTHTPTKVTTQGKPVSTQTQNTCTHTQAHNQTPLATSTNSNRKQLPPTQTEQTPSHKNPYAHTKTRKF